TFRYDLLSGRLETAGAAPSLGVRKWLRDTLPVHSRTVYDPKERLGAIVRTMEGVPRAIVYTAVLDKAGHPRTLGGLEQDPAPRRPWACANGCATRFRSTAAPCTTRTSGSARSCARWRECPAPSSTPQCSTRQATRAPWSASRKIRGGSRPTKVRGWPALSST